MKQFILFFIIAISVISSWLVVEEISNLKEENRGLSFSLAHAQINQPLQCDTIRDTVQVFTQQIVELERSDIIDERIADKQLIKDLKINSSQLESIHKMGTQTSDTIRIFMPPDSIFRYHDHWTDIKVNIPDSVLTYTMRDSTQIIVAHDYKHRFLWWRWGVKGYKVKVVNFNPHATILYNSYVKAK